jgi:hypothetical protein
MERIYFAEGTVWAKVEAGVEVSSRGSRGGKA